MLCICEAVDEPPLVLVTNAVLALAHREIEAECVHEPAVRTSAIDRWEPADQSRLQLTFPAAHALSPLTPCSCLFSWGLVESRGDCIGTLEESEAETAALLEAEIDQAIVTCGGDVRTALGATFIANTYLEAEIERTTEAISTGFAGGRMRKTSQRVKKI
jgi:hypothetical protein